MHGARCLCISRKKGWLCIALGFVAGAGYDQSRRRTGSQSIMGRCNKSLQSSLPFSSLRASVISSNRDLVDAFNSWLFVASMGTMSLNYVGEPPKCRRMIEGSSGRTLRTSHECLSFRGHRLGLQSRVLGRGRACQHRTP
jgi:hypothetical protein